MDTGHPKDVLQIKAVFYLKVISYLPLVFQFSEKVFT